MRALVLGAGMMGRAAAFDLARSKGVEEVVLGDLSLRVAREAASWTGGESVRPVRVDVSKPGEVRRLMRSADAALGAVSYKYNLGLTRAAMAEGCHFCDLGGNNAVVADQLAEHAGARRAGVAIVPDCGLAPGMVQVVAARALEMLGGADELRIRVGGLPLRPRGPFKYMMVFAPDGLINEYVEKAVALRGGRRVELECLTELEELRFPPPFGRLEAFVTSGGSSTLPWTLEGKVHDLDYKTIRYIGHAEKMSALLSLGLGSTEPVLVGGRKVVPRDLLMEMLWRSLPREGPDAVLIRLTARKGGRRVRFQLVDLGEPPRGITAMMRTTAFPASVVTWMLGTGRVRSRGVVPQELCIPAGEFLEELEKRGIRFDVRRY